MKLSDYGVYELFLGLKLHFTSVKYDYIKYHGKVNCTKQSFAKRPDKAFFYKLSIKHNFDDLNDLFIANLYHDPGVWIGNLLDNKSIERMTNRQKYKQNGQYLFKEELSELLDGCHGDISLAFGQTPKQEYPGILLSIKSEKISPETFFIADKILQFSKNWKFETPMIWEKNSISLEKYGVFIEYDKEIYKNILKKVLTNGNSG